jgi:hypothetical protein
MKLNYSEPKIYTGGVDISQWSKLSKKEQKQALSKHWYVYYYFRNPVTQKKEKQTNIKGGANRFNDKPSRYYILKQFKRAIEIVLLEGFNPYGENGDLKEYLENRLDPNKNPEKIIPVVAQKIIQEPSVTIDEAFKLALKTKENVLGTDSYKKFRSRISRFQNWLVKNEIKLKEDITGKDGHSIPPPPD